MNKSNKMCKLGQFARNIIMKQFRPLSLILIISVIYLADSCKSEPVTSIDSFDGVKLDFDNTGEGEITIILVHGWSNVRSIWDGQIAYFSKNYQVIAVDLPGFGKSGNNRSDWTIPAFGMDISTIIKELDLNNVVLVGFSIGGPIAIEAYRNVPDNIIGLVLVDALHDVELKYTPAEAYYIDSIMMDIVSNPTREKIVQRGFIKKNIDESVQRIISFLDDASHTGWLESLHGYKKWQNEDCINSIKAVKVPIIAIYSEIQPADVEAFRRYVPGFQANIIKDAGHLVMWDNPDEFNRLLEESIQEFSAE